MRLRTWSGSHVPLRRAHRWALGWMREWRQRWRRASRELRTSSLDSYPPVSMLRLEVPITDRARPTPSTERWAVLVSISPWEAYRLAEFQSASPFLGHHARLRIRYADGTEAVL
ncbi:MAG: hypothetical protein GWO03_07930 [Gammaproteobacteria bacterium]|nr:hypothetical protein [Gammaproteobacteria bacterium]